ncbi:MAG: class II aldolase/adducin family protein [Ruminiclostridium sp.]|nr:class II aldolase/adducin family protein [Ruminiclostridium sp.]
MYTEQLKELELISRVAGGRPDYVQGGGGNTSVKLDNNLMAVKASGFKLKDISQNKGYVVVNYKNIKEHNKQIDITNSCDFEKESSEFIQSNVVPMKGLKPLRPSVEAGFHSILRKYVIHTHPVYSNIICCSEEGRDLVDKIFNKKNYGTVWLPYINPGFSLMLLMKKEVSRHVEEHGYSPSVIFLENHGLVVTADTVFDCIDLHEEVNASIRSYLNITEDYPFSGVEASCDGGYISKSEYLKDYFKGREITNSFFDDNILYPDQLVYMNGNISVNGTENRLNINTDTGKIHYKTNEKEALTIEEILTSFVYVIENIKRNGFKLKAINNKGANFVRNRESEKYRKSLLYGKNEYL